jgi:hypothetical protein
VWRARKQATNDPTIILLSTPISFFESNSSKTPVKLKKMSEKFLTVGSILMALGQF